jgi:hypothetical protein
MKKSVIFLASMLLLGACQNSEREVTPGTEFSALIDGQTWSARPTATRRSTIHMDIQGDQGSKGLLAINISGATALFQPFTAEFCAPGIEVLNPRAMQGTLLPDTYWVTISYVNRATGESWISMTPAEGSGGQLVVTKAERNYLEGEFSGTLWGPIRLDREEWKDPRNLRPLKIEKGVLRVELAD